MSISALHGGHVERGGHLCDAAPFGRAAAPACIEIANSAGVMPPTSSSRGDFIQGFLLVRDIFILGSIHQHADQLGDVVLRAARGEHPLRAE